MVENDKLLRAIRLVDNIKIEIYQQGNKRKYGLIWKPVNGEYNSDLETPIRTNKFNIIDNDDDIIDNAIDLYIKKYSKDNFQKSQRSYYKIVQDPFKDSFNSRIYGSIQSPYYLNNGCILTIEWVGSIPTDNGYLDNQNITSNDDDHGRKIQSKVINSITGERDTPIINEKRVVIRPPKDSIDKDKILIWSENLKLEYDGVGFKPNHVYYSKVNDIDIIKEVVSRFIDGVKKVNGLSEYKLSLCNPDTESCSIIPYKSPITSDNVNTTTQESTSKDIPIAATQSNTKVKFNIEGLFDSNKIIEVKAKTDIPLFIVWAGDIPKPIESSDDFEDLDEYDENTFIGAEETEIEIESPSSIPEVSSGLNSISDASNISSFELGDNYRPGTLVNLPRKYSHTIQQGYNILNSKWIGDLITSAKSHIGHPTYDIAGTDNGNLGCASAVSMIFYRAFGVNMKTGKPVKEKPTDIGSFGTKSTSEAGSWFENSSLYMKINWRYAQPGDIINTSRNFTTNKAGHIGVVIDVRDGDGSWAIISNSSKGFSGGGGGAIKQNYSIKKWEGVASRNPSKTFAFRYIGPKSSNNI